MSSVCVNLIFPLLCLLWIITRSCMTVCRRSGPDFHSCSACCFCALQTDAPSNLFILRWAMGVTCCHCMAPIQRHPMYKLSVSMITLMSVCVYVPACSWTYAGRALCLRVSAYRNSLWIQPSSKISNMCMFIHIWSLSKNDSAAEH